MSTNNQNWITEISVISMALIERKNFLINFRMLLFCLQRIQMNQSLFAV